MKKITAVTIASVAAIALFLTGCSQVGAAATIGSTKITQATVQKSIDTVMAERTGVDTSQMQLETGENLNRSQLRFHLFAGLLAAAAKDINVTVSKAENIQKSLTASGATATDLPTKMQALIVATGKKYKVTVNPRYGVWKPDTAEVVAGTSTAVSPSASPSN